MIKRANLTILILLFLSFDLSIAQGLSFDLLGDIYHLNQTKEHRKELERKINTEKKSLSAFDYYHLAYDAIVNLEDSVKFNKYASKINSSTLRPPEENILSIGLELLRKKGTQQHLTKYELNSIFFDLSNTVTGLKADIEYPIMGSIIMLAAKDIEQNNTFINEATLKRILDLVYKIDFSKNIKLDILLKHHTLLIIGHWHLTTKNDPYKAVKLIQNSLTKIKGNQEFSDNILYYNYLDILAESYLQSNKLLSAFYARILIKNDLDKGFYIDKSLETKNAIEIASLYKKQNNPDSMLYYVKRAINTKDDKVVPKLHAYMLLSDWHREYNNQVDSAAYYLNYASQIMIENELTDSKEVIALVTKQLQLSSIDGKNTITKSLTNTSINLAQQLSLSRDNNDKLSAINFYLELLNAAEGNGDFSSMLSGEQYLQKFDSYFEELASGSIPWSFNSFLILNKYGKALQILNLRNNSNTDITSYLETVEIALKTYFNIRSKQVIKESLLYLGHNVSELLSTTSDIYYTLSKKLPSIENKQRAIEKSVLFADMNKAQLQVEEILWSNGLSDTNINSKIRVAYYTNLSQSENSRKYFIEKPTFSSFLSLQNNVNYHETICAQIDALSPGWNTTWVNTEEYIKNTVSSLNTETSVVLYDLRNGKGRIYLLSNTAVDVFPIRYTNNLGLLSEKLKQDLIKKDRENYTESANYLSDLLLAPLKGRLKKRVIIIADEEVSMVPFSMLPIDNDSYLIDHHIVSMAPSLRVISLNRKNEEIPNKSIATIIPVKFDISFSDDTVINTDRRTTTNLPYSLLEGQMISGIIKNNNSIFDPFNYYRVHSFENSMASRSNFLSEKVRNAEIVHVATHAYTDIANPENTHLLLNSQVNDADASLKLRDIYYMRLNANLLVLNGCETGSGKVLIGEGVVGISHAFLLTGVKNIIGTLWPVRDKAAAVFMNYYYEALFSVDRSERDYSVALQTAKNKMKAHSEYASPDNWANFYCITSHGTLNALNNN